MTAPPIRWLRGAWLGAALLAAASLATPSSATAHATPDPPGARPAAPEVVGVGCGAMTGPHRFWEDFPEVEPPPLHRRLWRAGPGRLPAGTLLGLLTGPAVPALLLGIGVLQREEERREWRRVRDG